MTPNAVPILLRADALVVEGTLAGCVAAHTLARQGLRVALAAGPCSLPFEIVVCRRPWGTQPQLAALPDPWRGILARCVSHDLPGGERLLNLARVAAAVEDALLDAGVTIFYGMTPCGVARAREGRLAGVLFGGKFGLRAVVAGSVVDCSPFATVTTLAGGEVRPRVGGEIVVHLSCKANLAAKGDPLTADRGQRAMAPVKAPGVTELRVAGAPNLLGGRVVLHGPFADFALRLPYPADDPFRRSRLAVAARMELIEIGARIAAQRAAKRMPRLFLHRFGDGLLTEPPARVRSSGDPVRPRGVPGLFLCGPAADVDDAVARRWSDPYLAARPAADAAKRIAGLTGAAGEVASVSVVAPARSKSLLAAHQWRFHDAPPLHAQGFIPLGAPRLPVVGACDVLVAGGGTAGVPAALAAAQSGARTTLLEQHADLGGVRTVGGVGSYWFGRETPCVRACDEAFDRISRRSGVAEELAMLASLKGAGVDVIPLCAVLGVAREGNRVVGLIAATDCGLALLRGKCLVDATGDADVAAWAGAEFEFGNGRDACTLWASFADFNEPMRTASRMYESPLDTRDPWDFARTIIRGRRRPGMWSKLPHEMPQHYVAPRESRRIVAAARVTYAGILAGQTFRDVMTVFDSNFDIKGIATSDLLRCGVLWSWRTETRFRGALPYSATVPRGLDGVIVAGRSYNASHDAISLARMQRDMVNLGAAAGVAAATSALTGRDLRFLDVDALQREWVRRGMLLAGDLRRWRGAETGQPYARAEIECDTRALARGGPSWRAAAARLSACHAARPALRRAFTSAPSRAARLRIARLLCLLGDPSPVPFLIDDVTLRTARRLPPPLRRTLRIPPEHGWAGDPVYSLHAIALAGRGRPAARLLARIAAAVDDDPERYAHPRHSHFEYVRALCAVAERSPGPHMLPALEELLRKKSLSDLTLRYDADLRHATDPVLERRAWLELGIGRALARCGDPRGYDILTRYLDDARGFLARSAETELARLRRAPRHAVQPWTERTD
jgi:hypothetical protein